ncbi:MAG TPA: ABC transporter permease [Lacunisphaera sp.]|jgi:ABC-2 type transport system permease protein
MNGFAQLLRVSLLLHFRNRLALIYGYLFPAIFLAAFWVLYRHEPVPLVRHWGQLITVTILGSACFGLPTTIVGERERGLWRRYRLTPARLGNIVFGTVVARFVIIVGAGALQLALAMSIGMSAPAHPLEFLAAFTFVSFALLGVGLMIAALADNVPAVQALGQCIFLPMLIIGGVAVPIESLPEWAQKVSAFFPGHYAVESLQACTDGPGLGAVHFDLVALAVPGVAGCFAGTKLFRWDAGRRFRSINGRLWLVPALVAWLAIGVLAQSQYSVAPAIEPVAKPPVKTVGATVPKPSPTPQSPPASKPVVPPDSTAAEPWLSVTAADIAGLNYHVPPDSGVVTPIARPDEQPDEATANALDGIQGNLAIWPLAHVTDPVQRTLNLLSVAAVMDLAQDPVERFLPLMIFEQLSMSIPRDELVQILAWIVLHPEQGRTPNDLADLGLGGVAQSPLIRERADLYAVKFIARLTGRNLSSPSTKPEQR